MPLPAPDRSTGTPPRRGNAVRGTPRNNNTTKASQPGDDRRGGKKKGNKFDTPFTKESEALNPPFDPRMRRIGSPYNQGNRIRRGWIQSKNGRERVNFLFNPSSITTSQSIDPNIPVEEQRNPTDKGTPFLATPSGTTGVKLLYDRTYELFSTAAAGTRRNFANTYGVYSDVAAWYVFLGMLPEMPTSWEETLIVNPAQPRMSYLFIGPKLLYYGWVTSLSVTYSHWTQSMVPARCAVDISFNIMPHQTTTRPPLPGYYAADNRADTGTSWGTDWNNGFQAEYAGGV